MSHVLFVCLHNAGRSQMSQALFERAAGGRHEAASAGATPGERVHPEVVEVMRERGIDLSERVPRVWNVLRPPKVIVRVGDPVQLSYEDEPADIEAIMTAIVDLLPPEARERRVPTAEELKLTKPPT